MAQPTIQYVLSFSEPHTHYAEVEMIIENWEGDTLTVKMATWTPGSYLIREYAKNLEGFEAATTSGKALKARKTNKNTWQIATGGENAVSIKYKLYGYELSVRTNFINSDHAVIAPAATFMYLADHPQLPSVLKVEPYEKWQMVSTSLEKTGTKWTYKTPDFDLLVDSPLEIGNHREIEFDASGVPHRLAIYGSGNYNEMQLVEDIKKIVAEHVKLFGGHPCKDYTVLLNNTENTYGGLEHLNSTSLMYPRWDYSPRSKYQRWLGLMSHEYFHLWNVKRIRPVALDSFDYENENYTNQLWLAEGVTSYYDDHLLMRAGLLDTRKYLDVVAQNINNLEAVPGRHHQSLAEASFDTWIKYYRSNENTNNCCVSYYLKGAVVATMLDLEILKASNGERSLDDVMRFVYDIQLREDRGLEEGEFQQAAEKIAGAPMFDFNSYVYTTEPIDYAKFFDYVGLNLVDKLADSTELDLGISTSSACGDKLTVSKVMSGTPSYEAGINVNDEIIAVNGYRVANTTDIKKVLSNMEENDIAEVLVSRDGILRTLNVRLTYSKKVKYKLERVENPSVQQELLYQKWLKLAN